MCNKLKLDKIKAMLIIASSQRKSNHKRNEKRLYFCEECNGWHTTSKDKKKS